MFQTSLRFGREDGALVSRAAFVAEARSWIGTPYVHQHDAKGVGCDCGGLLRGASIALGLLPTNYLDLLPQARGYSQKPDGVVMQRSCEQFFRRITVAEIRPGDVLLFRFGPHPQHTAIVADRPNGSGLTMIHSLGPIHPCKVIEHGLDETWRRRIVAAYSIPGVA